MGGEREGVVTEVVVGLAGAAGDDSQGHCRDERRRGWEDSWKSQKGSLESSSRRDVFQRRG